MSDEEVKVKWDLPFAFILNQDVTSFADTSDKVWKYPIMLPLLDDFRTNFNMFDNIKSIEIILENTSSTY